MVSVGAGFYVAKKGTYRIVISLSFALMTLGFSLIATLNETSSPAMQEIYLLICAAGIGALFQVPLLAIQASMPVSDMATTTATYVLHRSTTASEWEAIHSRHINAKRFGFIRALGGTIGINIGGAIFSSEITRRLSGVSGYTASNSALAGDVAGLNSILPLELRSEVLHAYTRAVNTIWIVCAPMLFIAFILSLFFKHCTFFYFSPASLSFVFSSRPNSWSSFFNADTLQRTIIRAPGKNEAKGEEMILEEKVKGDLEEGGEKVETSAWDCIEWVSARRNRC